MVLDRYGWAADTVEALVCLRWATRADDGAVKMVIVAAPGRAMKMTHVTSTAENSICVAGSVHYDGADGTTWFCLGRQCDYRMLAGHDTVEFFQSGGGCCRGVSA